MRNLHLIGDFSLLHFGCEPALNEAFCFVDLRTHNTAPHYPYRAILLKLMAPAVTCMKLLRLQQDLLAN